MNEDRYELFIDLLCEKIKHLETENFDLHKQLMDIQDPYGMGRLTNKTIKIDGTAIKKIMKKTKRDKLGRFK